MVQFNKMYVMLPVMLMARNIDGENPTIVFLLRLAYGLVQVLCIIAVAYTYFQSSQIKNDAIIYVAAPSLPFADPNAKKKYTEVTYCAHVQSTARSLLGATLFGLAMTLGLHLYKGMVMGLAMQIVMGPLNLIENPLINAVFFKNGIRFENKVFDEKTVNELTPDDEVVDEQGNPVVRNRAPQVAAPTTEATKSGEKSLEEVMLDTWDAGSKADIGDLMKLVDKTNCNYQTKENHWTVLMILAGLGAKGTASAIRQVKELGGDPAMVDEDGWNALHWAAFHGSVEAAKELKNETKLLSVLDKDGLNPIETAKKEGNNEIAAIFEEAAAETKKSK